MSVPAEPKIYHIVHVDRLSSIIADKYLWCDAEIARHPSSGTTIGMNGIKQRRLSALRLSSHPDLYVGACVPFYFCPRSVMLYVIYQGNHPELSFRDGQDPIVHLEADLRQTVAWAEEQKQRWAFTDSNAGSGYFNDWSNLAQLNKIDWGAVRARDWQQRKEGKQAEFLIERRFLWELVARIGVRSQQAYRQVMSALNAAGHKPPVEIKREWYYRDF